MGATRNRTRNRTHQPVNGPLSDVIKTFDAVENIEIIDNILYIETMTCQLRTILSGLIYYIQSILVEGTSCRLVVPPLLQKDPANNDGR